MVSHFPGSDTLHLFPKPGAPVNIFIDLNLHKFVTDNQNGESKSSPTMMFYVFSSKEGLSIGSRQSYALQVSIPLYG